MAVAQRSGDEVDDDGRLLSLIEDRNGREGKEGQGLEEGPTFRFLFPPCRVTSS